MNNDELYMNGLCYVVPSGYLTDQRFLRPFVRPLLTKFPDKQVIAADPNRYNMTWEYGVGAAGMSVTGLVSWRTLQLRIKYIFSFSLGIKIPWVMCKSCEVQSASQRFTHGCWHFISQ